MRYICPLVATTLLLLGTSAQATDYTVAPSGGDFTTIQAALNVAVAGDRVLVEDKPGGYLERLVFPRSGDTLSGPIELMAAPGHAPALDGTGVPGIWMITIQDRDYITVRGLEIRNNLGVPNDGSGIRIQGASIGVEIRDCVIHDMRGFGAMAITVYGTSTTASISDLVIDGNLVYDCEPADSEAITLNGNVERFSVTNNVVRDVNNIGIDFIGGETEINPLFVARDGVCRGNVVQRAKSIYGGGYAGGIYVDGGKDILIEGNLVSGSDLGIEIGAENQGLTTSGVVVQSNLIIANEKAGLVFGGYANNTGRVAGCTFANNVLFGNDTLQDGNGEIWVQYANTNVIAHNLVWPGTGGLAVVNFNGTQGNLFDRNAYFADVPVNQVSWIWNGSQYGGLAAWQAGTGFGGRSFFADPQFVDLDGPDDLLGTVDDLPRPGLGSPLIDAGDVALLAPEQLLDFVGAARRLDDSGVVDTGVGTAPLPDIGAFEVVSTQTVFRNGQGANPACLAQVSGAFLGSDWTVTVDANPVPGSNLTLLVVTDTALVGVSTPFGELLVATEALGGVSLASSLQVPTAGIALHTLSIPLSPDLVGYPVSCQALLLGAGATLCNALDLVLGY